jgi:hypothetical protein
MSGQLLGTDRLSGTLAGQGYVRLGAADFSGAFGPAELEPFRAEWASLPPDQELVDGGHYRFRRYGRLRVAPGAGGALDMTALPAAPFQQDARDVPLYGGRKRRFAPIPEAVLLHPVMRGLVASDLAIVRPLAPDVHDWEIGLHMVRIVAEPAAAGLPTPEGRHRDGHRFVGMHLLRRENCGGGHSLLYTNGGEVPDVELTLLEPLDALIVVDSALEHEVTRIEGAGGRGLRDMLLVDLNAAVE